MRKFPLESATYSLLMALSKEISLEVIRSEHYRLKKKVKTGSAVRWEKYDGAEGEI